MATETWYILEDGTSADPRDVAPDDKGTLKHKDGRAVAYSPHGPRSRSVDPEEEQAGKSGKKSKDMKPDDQAKLPYRTRESKAK